MNAIQSKEAKKARNIAQAAARLKAQQEKATRDNLARQATLRRLYNEQQATKREDQELAFVAAMLAGPHREQLVRFLAGRPATYARVSRFVPREQRKAA